VGEFDLGKALYSPLVAQSIQQLRAERDRRNQTAILQAVSRLIQRSLATSR
jgi:hypothetical protein